MLRKRDAIWELEWIEQCHLHKCTKAKRRRVIYRQFPELMPPMTKKILRTFKRMGRTTGYEGTAVQEMLDYENIEEYK